MNHNYSDNRKGEYYGNDNVKRRRKFHHRRNTNPRRFSNNENHYENHHNEVRDFKENRYSDNNTKHCVKPKLNPSASQFGGNCSTSTPKKTKQINQGTNTDQINLSSKSIQTCTSSPLPEVKKLEPLVELSEIVDNGSGEKKYICNRCKCVKDDLIQSKIEVEQWFQNENNNIFAGYMLEKGIPEQQQQQQQDFGNLSAIGNTEEDLIREDMIHLKLNKDDLTPQHLVEYKQHMDSRSNNFGTPYYDGSNDSMIASNQLDHMHMYVPFLCLYPVPNGEESPHHHHHRHHSIQNPQIQNPALDYSFAEAAQIANVSGPQPYTSCHFAAFYFTNYFQQPPAQPQPQNY